MAEIDIDFEKLHQASASLATRKYMFSDIKRIVGLSRWKLPEEIKRQKNIEERVDEVLRQLSIAEQLMHEIKMTTNSCISQYEQVESVNLNNAKKFM